MSEKNAIIFDIYRGTSHDGPGSRTTVFFKGCPLHCEWCHNPEGISPAQSVWWNCNTCIGCGTCVAVCPEHALSAGDDGIHVDRNICKACGKCVGECPTQAMANTATSITMDELMREVSRDIAYYKQTGGGVTASGGEAMLQSGFITEFFRRLHENGVTTALDTCGQADFSDYEKVLPYTDYVLYDIKLADSELHKEFTGHGNSLILKNAMRLAQLRRDGVLKAQIWIRTPLIPKATATAENLSAIGRFISKEMSGAVEKWELCAFNGSCMTKYRKFGVKWKYDGVPPIHKNEADKMRAAAVSGGVPEGIVSVTGIIAED